ncbi:carbohydrate ABC transporter permease [Clostridium sp. AN503]|uniref:carbohydrate ABC transporter permease n=1 Tax=Clostridium sp. AN503 TaxID=3160598 RepID=UPI00345944B1
MTRKQRNTLNTFLRYFVLVAIGICMIYPMIWMVGASFRDNNAEIFSSIGFIPKNPTLQGYIDGWNGTNYSYGHYMINTYLFVIPKVLGTIVSATITAYAFTRFHFKGKGFWYGLMLATLFLPQVVLNVPQFLLFTKIGWVDSYLPLVAPSFFACDTYFVFMMIQFMRSVPKELEEAAEIDGCNSFQRLLLIIVPMVQPAIVSSALFQFMWSSNDFMGPLIYINSTRKFPAALGLRLFMDTETGFQWNKVLALSIITILPSLVVFFLAQDQFVEGISAGGVKG